jgi:hypothetical protein
MKESSIPDMLGRLSHDIIVVYNDDSVICETNAVAERVFGRDLVDQPLQSIFSSKTQTKTDRFLAQMRELSVGDISSSWELYFDIPDQSPMPVTLRGGALDQTLHMIVGAFESPQLTAIYHEVLAINSELTNLIRQLSKEQAHLSAQLDRLLHLKEEEE